VLLYPSRRRSCLGYVHSGRYIIGEESGVGDRTSRDEMGREGNGRYEMRCDEDENEIKTAFQIRLM
jgi:hypothetical protein